MSGQVVGIVGCVLGHALEFDGLYGRLTGLAVDESVRRRGLGTHLMRHMEHWLRSQGAVMLFLTSGQHRKEAHKFYQALGYEQTGVRFAKRIG
jgi:GNAT superfamily N-acetyltransferase